MKEDLNIEELFKQGFENFEGNVDPSAWANISQSIGAGATGGATGATGAGLSTLAKVAIITGVAAVTSVSVWYFSNNGDDEVVNDTNTNIVSESNDQPGTNDNTLIVDNDNVSDADNNIEVSNGNDIDADNNGNVDNLNDNINDPSDNNESNKGTVINPDNSNGPDSSGPDNTVDPDENNTTLDPDESNPNGNNGQDEPNVTNERPEITANPSYDIDGQDVSFNANASNFDIISWTMGDGTTLQGENIDHTYDKPGTYIVKLSIYQDGIERTKNYEFKVEIEGSSRLEELPNNFTPNGDNDNDYYFIKSKGLTQFQVYILDLSGKIVFESRNPDFKWDGENKDGTGKVRPGKYKCVVSALGEDGKEHSGVQIINVIY